MFYTTGNYHSACFYCSTSGTAFGPVFSDLFEESEDGLAPYQHACAFEVAERFLTWLGKDPRSMTGVALNAAYDEFLTAKAWMVNQDD